MMKLFVALALFTVANAQQIPNGWYVRPAHCPALPHLALNFLSFLLFAST